MTTLWTVFRVSARITPKLLSTGMDRLRVDLLHQSLIHSALETTDRLQRASPSRSHPVFANCGPSESEVVAGFVAHKGALGRLYFF